MTGGPETRLIARDTELAALVSTLDAARSGAGAQLLIEGPAGIGKSALTDAARRRALEDGMRVLTGRGSEFERELPFGVVRQCLDPVVRRAGDRERLFRGAARLAEPVLLGVPDGIDAPPAGLLHGIYWAIANLSEDAPVALFVDDAHWADEPSLRLLAYLARRLDALRVALIVGARGEHDPGGAAGAALAEMRAGAEQRRLAPRPLAPDAVAELLREIGGQHVDDAFARACHEATGGNPFLLVELARTLLGEGVPFAAASAGQVSAVAPATVGVTVRATLRQLGEHPQALARAAAILSDGVTVDLAADVAGLPVSDATAAAGELVRAGLLRDERELRFRHPILASGAIATLTLPERSAAHARAAEVLRARGAAPDRVALQLLHTSPGGSAQVVDDLRSAARAAHAGGAPETAAVLLERALAEPPATQERGEVLLDLARAQLDAGHSSDAATHLLEAHRCAANPLTRARAALLLFRAAPSRQADREPLLAMIERSAAEVETVDADLALRLRALALLDGRLGELPDLAGDTPAQADVLGHVVLARMQPGARADDIAGLAQRAAGQVEQLVAQDMPIVSFAGITLGLTWADHLDEAEHVADRALAVARRRGSAAFSANAMTMRAHARRCAGRLREAEADARTALEVEFDREWAFARGLAPLICTLVSRGRADEAARELADAFHGAEIPESPPMVAVLLARMWVRAAHRDHEAALADWREALRWIRPRSLNAGWLEDVGVAVDALVATGDRAAADALVAEAAEVANAWGTPRARGVVLRMRARLGDGDEIRLLSDAVELFVASPARFEEARARVALGAALRRAGRRVDSRDPLRAGHELAVRCGADGLAEQARSELRASGIRLRRAPASGADELTPSERRIAELAASGLSNPEIAQELFLTVKTIEMHLTRCYRKLGIRGRGELAQAMAS